MRALYIHISGLAGLLVFLKEVLNYAPLERTILVSATTGLTVYLMLIVGHTIVQRIMAYSPPAPSSRAAGQANQGQAPSSSPVDKATATVAAAQEDAPPEADTQAPSAPTDNTAPAEDGPADEAAAPEPADTAPDRAPQDEPAEPTSTNSVAQTTA